MGHTFQAGKTYMTKGGQAMRIERWSAADGRYATEQSRRPVWYLENGNCDVREWDHYDLLPGAVEPAVGESETQQGREAVAAAIRTFCKSLGAGAVSISHGVERIYYAGISLDALACAVHLAILSPSSGNGVALPVACAGCQNTGWCHAFNDCKLTGKPLTAESAS